MTENRVIRALRALRTLRAMPLTVLGSLLLVGAAPAADLLPGVALPADPSSRQAAKVDPTFGDQTIDDDTGTTDSTDPGEGDDRTSPEAGGRRNRDNDFSVGGGKAPTLKTDVAEKVFYDAEKPAKFSFSLNFRDKGYFDDHRVVAKVDLQKKNRNEEIDTWRLPVDDSGDQTVKWDSAKDGAKKKNKAPSPGKYEFVLTTEVDGKTVKPKGAHRAEGTAFDFYTNIFPIDGKHDLSGGKKGRFGAGRSGHKHQGQDIFARCGVPLRAARGGRVQANQFQSSAGFYVVIDANGTDVDYVYMHLKKRSDYREGDKISTGEHFGLVGDTGQASGCHLHFELWTKPGWFEGGKAYDPLPQLKGWDKFS